MERITQLVKKYWLYLLGIAVGAAGGYLYWLYIGCESGSCPITSSPISTAIWGAIMGGILSDMFVKKEKS